MKDFIAALLLLVFFSPAYGNFPIIIQEQFRWEEAPFRFQRGGEEMERWSFNGAVIDEARPDLPVYIRQIGVDGPGRLQVRVVEARYEPFERRASSSDEQLGEQLSFETSVERAGRRYQGKIAFVPIIKRGARYERLLEVSLEISFTPSQGVTFRGPENTDNSVLSDGAIYRIAVSRSGLHRLSYAFLKDELGIDIDNVDPRRIKVYGNGGGMLPTNIATARVDDLAENRIFISGEDDGNFDSGDYLLFYAEGPDTWRYDGIRQQFTRPKNIYDTRNYYFIKISGEEGQRVVPQASLAPTATTSTSFDDFARFEEDRVNLLHEWRPLAQGSGPRWYGDHFKNRREYQYQQLFEFPNLVAGESARVQIEMALRSTTRSRFTARINGAELTSTQADFVSDLNNNEVRYADTATIVALVTLDRAGVDVNVSYPHPQGVNDRSEAWLDYIQVEVRRQLVMTGDQLVFRDTRTLDFPSATFELRGAGEDLLVWDVTDPLRPALQEVSRSGDRLAFGAATNELRTFVAFRPQGNFPAPEAAGQIGNQNLHGIQRADMVIITHADFLEAAEQLAEHRRRYDNMEVAIATVQQIFNEFSSGRRDPTAIRDFARMLFERSPQFRYLLLLGDGSFDTRDIYGLGTDFVPVLEADSFNPIFSFPADDYYALLDDPSANPLAGSLDLAVGRIPAKTPEEARGVVDKIINYDTNPRALGDWRNRVAFVGDDEDGSRHTRQADEIADTLSRRYNFLNIDKIFFDAYPQVSTPGGARYPGVNEAINQSVFKGTLVITYLGHGGASGWAEERVLSIPDILSWENFDQPPLLVTATCSFAGYDDPVFTTAGEEAILNSRGGAIGLLTTVRAVFSSFNRALTEEVMKALFEQPGGSTQTIGEIMTSAKNKLTSSGILTNSRKFTLLGDPAMRIAQPNYGVATTRINAEAVSEGRLDTLRALQRVTVEGQVLRPNGQPAEEFNGILSPTIYDKRTVARTLGQDRTSPIVEYEIQKNVIFRGRATVEAGRFSFTFVVPRDINYELGRGKISYYGSDERALIDATGAYEAIAIGGTDPDAALDEEGPQVDVFMNTEDFAFGGITNEAPTLLVLLEDENGINVVGNSIGHDLEAVLDEDTQNTFLLNDFYESEIDDYRRGKVRYPLARLEEGRHTLRVKAWDVANNSAEGYTEFVVATSGEVALRHVLNYPNPFSDRTCFQFDHNLTNQELDVMVQIYTISGRLVKTLEQTILSDGAIRLDNCIEWNGRDDFGDPLARGVYLYRVSVRTSNTGETVLKGESDFEKLVLLK